MAVLKRSLRRKNATGNYDTIRLESDSSIVYRPSGRTVEQDLAAYLPSTQSSDVVPKTLNFGKIVTGKSRVFSGGFDNIIELENVDKTNEGKQLIANAITDMGVPTSGTDSFATMEQNIRNIASSTKQLVLMDHVDIFGYDFIVANLITDSIIMILNYDYTFKFIQTFSNTEQVISYLNNTTNGFLSKFDINFREKMMPIHNNSNNKVMLPDVLNTMNYCYDEYELEGIYPHTKASKNVDNDYYFRDFTSSDEMDYPFSIFKNYHYFAEPMINKYITSSNSTRNKFLLYDNSSYFINTSESIIFCRLIKYFNGNAVIGKSMGISYTDSLTNQDECVICPIIRLPIDLL